MLNVSYIKTSKTKLVLLLIIPFCISLFSCTSYKKIPYFQDVSDTVSTNQKIQAFIEPIIQYDDILSISINTLDLQSNNAVNMPTAISSSGIIGAGSNTSSGTLSSNLAIPSSSSYRVTKTGEIDLPLLGKIFVSGLTTNQVKDTIQKKMTNYYKTPTVDVRFANFKVTVLGEVTKPGTFTIPNEKFTLFDALGLSGDLTIFGRRENVLLIRDSADNKQLVRLNLNSKQIISSPYFYLKQNDVVYVEPTNAKIANLDAVQNRYITIASAIISVLIIVISRIK